MLVPGLMFTAVSPLGSSQHEHFHEALDSLATCARRMARQAAEPDKSVLNMAARAISCMWPPGPQVHEVLRLEDEPIRFEVKT